MNILSPQLEYLCARRKDLEILSILTSTATTCFRDFFNTIYSNEISMLVECIYLSASLLTTNLKQTPGQEHTSTAICDFSKVSKFRRVLVSSNYIIAAKRFSVSHSKTLIYIFLKSIFPYILKKLSEGLQRKYKSLRGLPSAEEIIQEVSKLNFAVFLITGYFDEISKRVLGFVYIKLQRSMNQGIVLKRLGYLMLVQCFFAVFNIVKRIITTKSNEESKEIAVKVNEKEECECVLCLSQLKAPTATPCGHVFCWMCIMSAVNVSGECPNCRQAVAPQALLQLRNL